MFWYFCGVLKIKPIITLPLSPFLKHGAFVVSMYALGLACAFSELHFGKRDFLLYENIYAELFIDVYAVAFLLSLLPDIVSRWLKRIIYLAVYLITFSDAFCFVEFGSALTPTMLMLVGETNGGEAAEFLKTYADLRLLTGPLWRITLVLAVHIVYAIVHGITLRRRQRRSPCGRQTALPRLNPYLEYPLSIMASLAVVIIIALLVSDKATVRNKKALANLYRQDTISSVETILASSDSPMYPVNYTSVHRLAFSLFANRLTSKQLKRLLSAENGIAVDSCSFRSPLIVLIIGESYNKHHTNLYKPSYRKTTTPRQVKWSRKGNLVLFDDVVAPWNLTSYVFKRMFSLWAVGDKGEWCDYPLFPELFRKAGYEVTFLTNQFLPRAREAVYDFSGGFFLNNPVLSRALFDRRNSRLYRYDESIVKLLDKEPEKAHQLIIIHLKGQHPSYEARYPRSRRRYSAGDYTFRKDLRPSQRRNLAAYDNATLYNDSVVDMLLQRLKNRDAVAIYVPDHGEEVYDFGTQRAGRDHQSEITLVIARQEYEIPFWIWFSDSYIEARPATYQRAVEVSGKPFMTDNMPQVLLGLAGIHCRWYHPDANFFSPEYNAHRARLLKGKSDYDKLCK